MMNSEGLTSPPQGTFVRLEVRLTLVTIMFEVVLLTEKYSTWNAAVKVPIQYQITLVPRSHPARISLPVLKAICVGVGFGSWTETSIRSENVCFLQSYGCIFSFLGFAVWVKLFLHSCVCMSDSDHYLQYSGKLSREKTAYFCYFSFSEQCAFVDCNYF